MSTENIVVASVAMPETINTRSAEKSHAEGVRKEGLAHTNPVERATGAAEWACVGMSPLQFRGAVRVQQSLTAPLERRVLRWLAERIPVRIGSDHLTLLGFLAQICAAISYACARWSAYGMLGAIFFLAVNWFGDSLDGTLARVRNRQRPRYGFYVDHVTDTFGAMFLMVGLAISGYLDWRVAAAMLTAFLMLSIEVYLATYTLGAFHLSFAMFGPTEIRVLLAIANLRAFYHPDVHIGVHAWKLFDVGGVLATAGMLVMLASSAVVHTRRLYEEERLP